MSSFEGSRRQRLQWMQAHLDAWQTNMAAINLTSAQMTNMKNLTNACAAKFTAAEAARDAAKGATTDFYAAADSMSALTRDLIATIKAYAQTTNNPGVYALAQIDPPAPPTPVPAPDVPKDFTGFVSPIGQVTLTWKATPSGASSGVFFMVERKRPTDAGFFMLGATAEKSFIDVAPHLTGGVVQYRVKAQRGPDESEWTANLAFDISGGSGVGILGYVEPPNATSQAA